MRSENVFEALSDIDERYIQEAAHVSVKKKTRPMWVKISAVAASVFVTIGAALFALNQNMPWAPHLDGQTNYGNTTAYVGWSDNQALYEGALNRELLSSAPNEHLPIFKIDTMAELAQFKTAYENILAFDQGYGTALSFDGAMSKAQWDREIFYQDYSLLIVYVPANSGSFRFIVDEVKTEEASICISVGQKQDPENSTEDMAGWLLLIEVEDEEISKYTSFDAVLSSK